MNLKKSLCNIKRIVFIILLAIILWACQLTISSIDQPLTGYTNSNIVVPIRMEIATGGAYAYTVSVQIPENWEVQDNQFSYIIYGEENIEGIAVYNEDNTASLPPAEVGYKWWSGITQDHTINTSGYATGYLVFNTDSVENTYNIDYAFGDTYNNNLLELQSYDHEIIISSPPSGEELTNAQVFPETGKAWDNYSFEVDFLGENVSVSGDVYIDDIPYNLDQIAGSEGNGRYYKIINSLSSGEHEYYFLFDNNLRYPETGCLIGPTVDDVFSIPFEETFELDSSSKDAWTFLGENPSWEIAIPTGYENDPANAYAGDYIVGTDITDDGLSNSDENSALQSPVFDARDLDYVYLTYQEWIHSENGIISIEIENVVNGNYDTILDGEYGNSETWTKRSFDISEFAAGNIFKLYFTFKSVPSISGWNLDNISIKSYPAQNPSPENYSWNILPTTDLSWDNPAEFENVKVYLKANSNQFTPADLVYDGIAITTLSNGDLGGELAAGTDYYWRVDGISENNITTEGDIWSFNTATTIYNLSGFVLDDYSNEPVAGALIESLDGEGGGGWRKDRVIYSTTSAADGSYSLNLPEDAYYFTVTKEAFIEHEAVYINMYEGNVVQDFRIKRVFAESLLPSFGSWNVPLSTSLSWQNPTNTDYNYTVVEISESKDMSNPTIVYSGPLVSNVSSGEITSSMGGFEYSTSYFWRVILSENNNSKFAPSPISHFISEFSVQPPQLATNVSISGYDINNFSQTSDGYLLTFGDSHKQDVMKLDSDGNMLWQNNYSTDNSFFTRAIESSSEIIVGRTENTAYISGERTGITSINSSGSIIWNQAYKYEYNGNYSNERVNDIIEDNSGNYILAGGTGFGEWDFLLTKTSGDDNTPIFQKRYGETNFQEICEDVLLCDDGGYLLTGYQAGNSTNSITSSRVFVIKVNSNGVVQWEYVEGFGSSNGNTSSHGYSAIQTSDGEYLIGAYLHDDTDSYYPNNSLLIKLNANGEKVWHKNYAVSFYGQISSLTEDIDGGYLLAGRPDIIKTDVNGNMIWMVDTHSGSIFWNMNNIYLDNQNRIIVADNDQFMIYGAGLTNLPAPTNLTISILNNNDIELNWNSVDGANSYSIFSDTEANGDFSTEEISGLATTNWIDTNVTDAKKFYRVVASTNLSRNKKKQN